ncbi:MAG: family N-acetyltransferase [Labilithrix sp.]|jgi:RimJ/RimL family protein N-acetyltransferase|nr:family N-acetyltransferase [Labilithrix sp.]
MIEAGPSVSVPRIATERLLLREFRMSDFDVYAANLADPIATEHLSSGVSDRRTAWRMFASGTGAWMLQGAGWWAIELRETGAFAGTVGAFYRDGFTDLEVSWTVVRAFWRRGIATEAARAALAYAVEKHAAPRAIALIDAANVASIRVSANLGMRYETNVSLHGQEVGQYATA